MKFTLKTVTLLGFLVLAFVIGRAQFQVGGDIDGMTGERLGKSVSMSADGKRMAVGAIYHSGGGKNLRGRAQVFEYNGSSWQQLGADILGDDAGDRLGWSVSLSSDGNRLAVGTHGYNNFDGAVRIFEWNGSNWNLLGAEIGGTQINGRFGIHLSLAGDGNRVAIGNSPNDYNGGYEAGEIKVYEYNGSSWTQLGADINSKGNVNFPSGLISSSLSISKDGKRVAFGERDYGNAGLVRIFEYIGSSWQQIGADITPPAGNPGSGGFGHAVSLSGSGNRVAIGAPNGNAVRMYEFNGSSWQQMGADINGGFPNSVSLSYDGSRVAIGSTVGNGQVRVYDYNGSSWVQSGLDIDGASDDLSFGNSVSLSQDGKRVAIGAHLSANQAGRAKVYEFPCFAPTAQIGADIDGEAAGDESGGGLVISHDGKRLAISAVGNDGNGTNAGHVRVFEKQNNAWVKIGDIDGVAAEDFAGLGLAMSGDGSRLAVGAHLNDGSGVDAGHARVFEYTGGSWQQLGADIEGEAAGDQFGHSISMSKDGTRLVIGAIKNGGIGPEAGHARVFEYINNNWVQLGSDIEGEAAGDNSGWSVSMSDDGNRLVVGSRFNSGNGTHAGHARIFQYNGSDWAQLGADIDGAAIDDQAGAAVDMSGDGKRVAVGAFFHDGNGNNSGHVRIFEYNGSNWNLVGSGINGEAADDLSGFSVSLSQDGKRVASGAVFNDGNGAEAGHVRVFEEIAGNWVQVAPDFDGEASNDGMGYRAVLSADGYQLAISAIYNSDGGSTAGHVRVFQLAQSFSPPAIQTPGITQPVCGTPTGSITVNATHIQSLAYSIDNGNQWQTGNVFSNLAPNNYDIQVRMECLPACKSIYPSNPVVINPAPTNCCTPAAILAEQNCSGCSEIRINMCQHASPPDLNQLIQTNTARDAATSLKWYADNGGSKGTALGSVPTINTANKGKSYFWVTQDKGNSCESPARKVRVKVNPISVPVFGNVPGPICGSPQLDLAQYISDPTKKATKFTFYTQDPVTNPNATPIGSVKAKKGMVKSGENMIITPNANTPTYWAKAKTANGCGGVGSTTLSLPPVIATVTPIQNLTVTAGDPVNIPMSGQNANNIIWNDHSSFSNPNIGIIGTMGMPPLAFTAQNTGSTNLVVKIRVIPYNGNCAGTPLDFNITVKPAGVPRQGPLNRLQFAGMQLAGRDVALDWQIVYDQELLRFEVEKEMAEDQWAKIGEVNSHGNGNYGFTDHEASNEVSRYRLKLIHADGRIVWSNVIMVGSHDNVTPDIADRFTVYPNPTTDRLTIRQQDVVGTWEWKLTDITGKALLQGNKTGQDMSMDLTPLASGVYHVEIITESGQRTVKRLIKQ